MATVSIVKCDICGSAKDVFPTFAALYILQDPAKEDKRAVYVEPQNDMCPRCRKRAERFISRGFSKASEWNGKAETATDEAKVEHDAEVRSDVMTEMAKA